MGEERGSSRSPTGSREVSCQSFDPWTLSLRLGPDSESQTGSDKSGWVREGVGTGGEILDKDPRFPDPLTYGPRINGDPDD